MSEKFNATVKTDKDKWTVFKIVCQRQGTTATARINRWIEDYLSNQDLAEDKIVRLDGRVSRLIDLNKLLSARIDRLEERIRDNITTKNTEENKTDETDKTDKTDKTDETDKEIKCPHPKYDEILSDEDFAAIYEFDAESVKEWRIKKEVPYAYAEMTETYEPTELGWGEISIDWLYWHSDRGIDVYATSTNLGTDETGETDKKEKVVAVEAITKKATKVKNQISREDSYVAKAENLSKESVRRYRVGMRNPKDTTFWERWQINPQGTGWYKIG